MKKVLCTALLSCSLYAATAQIPDSTFGTDALVSTIFNGTHEGYSSVTLQADGKIITPGYAKNANGKMECIIARYNTNGTLDNTFNLTGKVTIPATVDELFKKAVVQPDGKIVVVGTRQTTANDWSILLTRFEANGTIDNTFGTSGTVVTSITGSRCQGTNVALQSDGKIVVAGSKLYDNFILARFNANGTPDNTFGTNGMILSCYDAAETISSEGNGLAIQPDGKILISGAAWGNYPTIGIARYDVNGTIDNTFGTSGRLIIGAPTSVAPEAWGGEDIALLSNGQILITVILSTQAIAHQPCIVSVNSNGTIDNTFGLAGFARPAFSNFYEVIHQLAVQPDGKILAAGYVQGSSASIGDSILVLRFEANGTPSTTFGNNGRMTINRTAQYGDRAKGIALQTDGKILVAGSRGVTNNLNNIVMRIKYASPTPNSVAATGAVNDFNIFPNPVGDNLTISCAPEYTNKDLNITIFNTTGQLVSALHTTGKQQINIDVSSFSKGVYYLSIKSKNSPILHKAFIHE